MDDWNLDASCTNGLTITKFPPGMDSLLGPHLTTFSTNMLNIYRGNMIPYLLDKALLTLLRCHLSPVREQRYQERKAKREEPDSTLSNRQQYTDKILPTMIILKHRLRKHIRRLANLEKHNDVDKHYSITKESQAIDRIKQLIAHKKKKKNMDSKHDTTDDMENDEDDEADDVDSDMEDDADFVMDNLIDEDTSIPRKRLRASVSSPSTSTTIATTNTTTMTPTTPTTPIPKLVVSASVTEPSMNRLKKLRSVLKSLLWKKGIPFDSTPHQLKMKYDNLDFN
ncbi:uncharacterized protein BX664DRAFT_325085, partial [Halteromyces radiatus]|uniref:uncharacterized protein n=1 Tax=Halteromyces radiatus TaxID=101107 RepID=UPI00221ED398